MSNPYAARLIRHCPFCGAAGPRSEGDGRLQCRECPMAFSVAAPKSLESIPAANRPKSQPCDLDDATKEN